MCLQVYSKEILRNNSYGRIIRVKEKDTNGKSSGKDAGKVIEIMEAKDIEALPTENLIELFIIKKRTNILSKNLKIIESLTPAFMHLSIKNLLNLLTHFRAIMFKMKFISPI